MTDSERLDAILAKLTEISVQMDAAGTLSARVDHWTSICGYLLLIVCCLLVAFRRRG